MELALQVLGLKLTGKVEDAKNVALRIVGNTADHTSGSDAGNIMQVMSSKAPQFEASILRVLSLLDVPLDRPGSLSVSSVISRQTPGGQTMLHLATILGLAGVVDFLLAHEIDTDQRDRNGYTALHFAATARTVSCAQALIRAGADLEVVDARGQAPRDLAPPYFFRGMALRVASAQLVGFSSDEEAGLGDVEDDSDSEARVRVLRRRIPRKKPSTLLPERVDTPALLVSTSETDGTAVPLDKKRNTPEVKAAPVDEKPSAAEEKRVAPPESYAELLHRALAQLSRDGLANVPHLRPLLPPFADLSGIVHGALPHLPLVFPIVVPAPAWPAFLDKRTPSTDGGSGEQTDLPRTPVALAMKTAGEWLAFWEKLRAQALPASALVAESDSPPPVYTPRVSEQDVGSKQTDTLQATYLVGSISDQVVEEYKPTRKQLERPSRKSTLIP
jgi:hypothetical protein